MSYKACNDERYGNGEDNPPTNSIPMTIRICADSRRENCPYLITMEINTEFITLLQFRCGYDIRKK